MDQKIECLWKLLKDKGDLLLTGKAKLCLELEELIYLSQFKQLSYDKSNFVIADYTSTPVNTILDFIQKTHAVKIVGNDSICQLFSMEQFKLLKYLELYNIPVEIITNVDYLKDNLKHITLHRSCTDLCAFLVSDDETKTWRYISRATLCFNNITTINHHLSLMFPNIKHLDISHNNIRDIGNSLKPLKFLQFLGISFNLLEDIPIITSPDFKTLVARSNNIKMLDGFFEMMKVVNIDLRDNCLEYLEQLNPLSHLNKLQALKLSGNPIAFNTRYRAGVLKELNHHLNADVFHLDGIKVSLDEYAYLSIPSSYNRITVAHSSKASFQSSGAEISDKEPCDTNFQVEGGVDVNSKFKRTPKKQRPVVAEEIYPTNVNISGTTDEIEIAKSMKDRYEDDWVSWFDVRDTNNIVPDIDLGLDLDDITKHIDTFVEEEEKEEIPADDIEEKEEKEYETETLDSNKEAVNIDIVIADTFSEEEQQETPIDVDQFQDLPQHFVTSDGVDLFLTLLNDTLIERDSIGQVVQKMDINCLTNFIDDDVTVKLYFNHVLADRKFRLYEFNSNTELQPFLSEIEEIWRSVRDKNVELDEVKCLNCNHVCFKSMVDDTCIACGNHNLIPVVNADNSNVASPRSVNTLEQFMSLKEHLLTDNLLATASDSQSTASGVDRLKSDEEEDDRKSYVSSTYSSRTNYSVSSAKSMFITQNNFVTADHQLELYMEVKLFQHSKEVKCCYLFCQYAKYGKMNLSNALLVVSNYMVYVCKVTPPQKLMLKSRHRLPKLMYLDIGLNRQHFKMEWASLEASYKFLVYDAEKCTAFLDVLTLALPATTQISYISNSTVSAIHELVFGIDKSFELAAKGKRYHHILSSCTEKYSIQDRNIMFKTHTKCLPGSDLVDWLIQDGECDNRAEAVDLCQQMLLVDIIHHVKYEEQFHDDNTLYRFAVDEEGYNAQQDYVIRENLNKEIVVYQLGYIVEKHEPTPASLILSNIKLFITHEYHQWPLPRLQAPLPLQLRGQHFQVLHEIDITDISMIFKKADTLTVSTQSKTYDVRFVNERIATEILDTISRLWEDILGFPLQIKHL